MSKNWFKAIFNAGLLSDGEAAAILGRCYADALQGSGVQYDMLFGPAYKGIPLVTATAIALADHHGRRIAYAFNRKEAKDHGEGGSVVGTTLHGRVVIVDDVITAGTAVRESLEIIRGAGAEPATIVLALDRQERGRGDLSAVQEVEKDYALRCVTLITLDELIEALSARGSEVASISEEQLTSLRSYRARFGVQ